MQFTGQQGSSYYDKQCVQNTILHLLRSVETIAARDRDVSFQLRCIKKKQIEMSLILKKLVLAYY
jgi:hypothetical protein